MVSQLGEVMWVSTSTASRSTASCRTSPPAGSPRCSRPPAGTSMMVKYGPRLRSAGAARAHRRDAQRGVPAAAARRRARAARAARGRRRRPRRRRAAGHVPRPRRARPRRADRRLPPGRRGARPPERRLRLHDQGLAAADRGPPRQPLRAAQRTSSTPSWRARSARTPTTRGRAFDERHAGGRAVRGGGARLRARAARARPAAAGAGRPRPRAPRQRLHPAGVRALLRRPRARGARGRRARRHRVARRRHLDQPRRLDQQGRHLDRSATGSTGSPTTPTRSCAGARPTTAATSSSGSPRSTSSALLGELGATWSRDGQPLLPVGTIYDPFVARALEPWSFGIYAGGQSILVGTPSGVTLGPEGGAHQSVITPSIGIEQPGCVAWEPAFGQDFEWSFLHALSQLGRPDGGSAYFRLSTRPIDQSLAGDAVRARRCSRAATGCGADGPRVVIAVMGALVPEAIEAAEELPRRRARSSASRAPTCSSAPSRPAPASPTATRRCSTGCSARAAADRHRCSTATRTRCPSWAIGVR